MSRQRPLLEMLRRSFWFLPALALVGGAILGYALPVLDEALQADVFLVELDRSDSARGLLETIATVTVSVAGIAFSITVVALQLASQQLGPRVLRTFQDNRLSQATLAVFLGTFAYCIVVLTSLGARGPGGVPQLSVTVAIVAAAVAFGLFVAFIHDIVESLQASTLIRRIALDGHAAIGERFPEDIGAEPANPSAARREVDARCAAAAGLPVRAPRAGYLRRLDGEALLSAAARHEALVVQRARLGDFVLTDGVLAEVWLDGDDEDAAVDISAAFQLGDERTVVQDAAFPVRQLADVALRALSPSLNDPTTAENAMGSLADTLVRFARAGSPSPLRVDGDGCARLLALPPDLDDLVRLGFDQVRVAAAGMPTMAVRLLALLAELEAVARDCGRGTSEIERQARLTRESAGAHAPTPAGGERVRGQA